MLKRLLIVAALVVTSSSVMSVSSVSATPEPKVEICHSRQPQPSNGNGAGPQGNPYGPKRIEVSASAITREGHSIHNGPVFNNTNQDFWGDIIPPFGEFEGMNWDAAGIAIWSNDCQYPVPSAPVEVANIKATVECEVDTRKAVITLTNTGLVAGSADIAVGTNAPKTVLINVGTPIVEYVTIPTGGVQIKITTNGKILFNELYTCIGGQGGGVTPPVPTPVVTTPAPVAGAGESTVVAADEVKTDVASLPYTAGGVNIAVLIAALAAVLTVMISFIAKKTFLKQI